MYRRNMRESLSVKGGHEKREGQVSDDRQRLVIG